MNGEELTVQGNYGVVNFEEYAMASDSVVRQIHLIQDVMKSVMKVDEHYGTIPGTNKPSLYKPGAEKLSLVFRLRPEYRIERTDMPNGHREYEVTCTLYHIPTGQSVGEGVGSATTMEGKYRFRGGEKEGTGKKVPTEYWNLKNSGKTAEAKALIGGLSVGKIDGQWEICIIGEKQEHDNPADYYNTVLKMAKKRAHVDAILTATAASDIFTQDVEDMPEVMGNAPTTQERTAQGTSAKPPVKQPQEKKADPAPTNGDARSKFPTLLETYCSGDLAMMADVCQEVSTFKNNKGEKRCFAIEDVMAQREDGSYIVSDQWMNSSYGKLKKMAGVQG